MITALDKYLLRAYLDDSMDEAAAEAFELLLIERPELAELVIADVALDLGLKAEADSGLLPPALHRAAPASAASTRQTGAAPKEPAPQTAAVVPLRTGQPAAPETSQTGPARGEIHPPLRERRRSAAPYLAAAAALLAVGLGLGRQLQPGQPMLSATEVAVADTLRGSGLRQVRLPAAGALTLSVPVILTQECTPPLLLSLAQGGRRWEIEPNKPVDDYVHVRVDAGRLQPGTAEIQLSCAGKPLQTTGVEFTR
ncbi:hypothetical protein [Tahibacter harae]|uniref:Anti-sigma factor n=1 Tax=Tahibacter harae TaxID=2963937 RepID=A0ABT1QL52_9GAMM|nr:hypothetical protein [Tahibacter harae]MCQ4163261.1 hypothetical protein [Tahibacter harae]